MKGRPEPGTPVRLTSAFLGSTGQSRRNGEGKRTWTVLACPCAMCATGRYACTDEEHDPEYRARTWGDLPEERRPKYRHLAVANVEAVGKVESEPRAEVAWWERVVPSVPYPAETAPAAYMSKDLAFAVRYMRGEVFWRWCGYLWACGFAHGSELAEALGTGGLLSRYPTGDPDSCASADRLLAAAEEAGWVRRVSPGRMRALARRAARGEWARAANAGDTAGVDGAKTALNEASGLFLGDTAEATPTREQMFFGADGAFGKDVRKKRCPRLFGWEPVRGSALREWLGCDGPAPVRHRGGA